MASQEKVHIAEENVDSLGLNRLPSTKALSGRSFELRLDNGAVLTLKCEEETASFSATGMPEWPETGTGFVDVVEIRENVYYVDIDTAEPGTDSLTVILLLNRGWAVTAHQRRVIPTEEFWTRGPEVKHEFHAARISGLEQQGEAPAPTLDLLGARNFMMMGPGNLYEHIYINSRKMVAHHVRTKMAQGKCERHPATYYYLDEGLYLVGWREMDNAVGMVTVEDYQSKRMTGKAHHPLSLFESRTRPIGGHIMPICGKIKYPDGLMPD